MGVERIYYTADEAATALNVGKSTMYKLCRRADFPAVRVGRKIRIPIASLESWATAHEGEVLEL